MSNVKRDEQSAINSEEKSTEDQNRSEDQNLTNNQIDQNKMNVSKDFKKELVKVIDICGENDF